MTKYAVISNDPKAFFLGRYETPKQVLKATGGDESKWLVYELTSNYSLLPFEEKAADKRFIRSELKDQLLGEDEYEGIMGRVFRSSY